MLYIRWEFRWGTTGEIQDTGLWCHLEREEGTLLDWDTATQAAADKAVGAWATEMGEPAFAPSVVGVRAVAYHYDADLKHALNRAEAGFTGDNEWAGSGAADLPPENTMVMSLYSYEPSSYVANRARRRGRMYLPTPAVAQLQGSYQFPQSQVLVWLNMFNSMLNNLQGNISVPSVGAHLRPRIVSRGGNGGPAAEATYPVTYLRMGRLVDTQRRRRNQLPEEYEVLEQS